MLLSESPSCWILIAQLFYGSRRFPPVQETIMELNIDIILTSVQKQKYCKKIVTQASACINDTLLVLLLVETKLYAEAAVIG